MVILALPDATLALRLLRGNRSPGHDIGEALPGAPDRTILAFDGNRGAPWALVNVTDDPPGG